MFCVADFKISLLRSAVLGHANIFFSFVFQVILQHSSEQEEMRIFPGPLSKYVQWLLRACFSWHLGSLWIPVNVSDVEGVSAACAWPPPINLWEKCEKAAHIVFGPYSLTLPLPPSLAPNSNCHQTDPLFWQQKLVVHKY